MSSNRLMSVGLSFLIGLLSVACSQNKSPVSSDNTFQAIKKLENNPSIIGGTPVQNEDKIARSTVALYVTQDNGNQNNISIQNFCTGTLIASNVVLTAAHCIVDVAAKLKIDEQTLIDSMVIGFGANVAKEINTQGFEYRLISSFKVHQGYNIKSLSHANVDPMYDVALLKLSEDAPASAIPAMVGIDPKIIQKGLSVILAGFGLTEKSSSKAINATASPDQSSKSESSSEVRATHLQSAIVTVDDPAINAAQFTYLMNNHSGSCKGDSGGPAYIVDNGNLVLVGVTSWGDKDCKIMGAYTNVPVLKQWIWENIATL